LYYKFVKLVHLVGFITEKKLCLKSLRLMLNWKVWTRALSDTYTVFLFWAVQCEMKLSHWLDEWAAGREAERDFCFFRNVQPGCRAHPASYLMGTRVLSWVWCWPPTFI